MVPAGQLAWVGGHIHMHGVNHLSYFIRHSVERRFHVLQCVRVGQVARSMASQSSSQACHRVAERFAKDVYVHTVASSISNELFSSFFGHYHYSLGIPSERFHFVLHLHAQRDDDAAIRVLSKHNISWMSIRGHFDPSIRNGLVNSWVRTLPTSAYIINSDVDEHYVYPCHATQNVLHQAQVKRALCAHMVERVASTFILEPAPRSLSAMHRTFGLCASVRGSCARAGL